MDLTKSIYLILITLLLSEVETQNTKKDISMAQQMLSDMGLNQRPDIKNVSFSCKNSLVQTLRIIVMASIYFEYYTIEFFLDIGKGLKCGNDPINSHKGVINFLINFSFQKFCARHLKTHMAEYETFRKNKSKIS